MRAPLRLFGDSIKKKTAACSTAVYLHALSSTLFAHFLKFLSLGHLRPGHRSGQVIFSLFSLPYATADHSQATVGRRWCPVPPGGDCCFVGGAPLRSVASSKYGISMCHLRITSLQTGQSSYNVLLRKVRRQKYVGQKMYR